MFKKNVFILITCFFVYNHTAYAQRPRYEPNYSYFIRTGISYLNDPIKKQIYTELPSTEIDKAEDYSYTNLYNFTPSICVLGEYRFLDNILGLGGLLGYTNRKFGIINEAYLSKVIWNNYHLDYGLNIVLYPRGLGGMCFYLGMKFYNKIKANMIAYDVDNKNIDNEEAAKDIKNKLEPLSSMAQINYGIFGGFKVEIDRTGFIFGFEIEKFLNPLNKITNKDPQHFKLETLGLSFYFGYDFARLNAG